MVGSSGWKGSISILNEIPDSEIYEIIGNKIGSFVLINLVYLDHQGWTYFNYQAKGTMVNTFNNVNLKLGKSNSYLKPIKWAILFLIVIYFYFNYYFYFIIFYFILLIFYFLLLFKTQFETMIFLMRIHNSQITIMCIEFGFSYFLFLFVLFTKMEFTFGEYPEMHVMYRLGSCTAFKARRLYKEGQFPNSRIPDRKSFERVNHHLRETYKNYYFLFVDILMMPLEFEENTGNSGNYISTKQFAGTITTFASMA